MTATKHIAAIFQALDIGLDGLTELPDNQFGEVTNDDIPADIDPDRFNRMGIVIDGERYMVSVFRSTGEGLGDKPLTNEQFAALLADAFEQFGKIPEGKDTPGNAITLWKAMIHGWDRVVQRLRSYREI